ncbi:MAG: ribonuclease HII [Nanoarchaeota archaeon]
MRILGIDEAGRGPVLGPLVMAGALMEDDAEQRLRDMGVKDSKLLTKERREEIFNSVDICLCGKEVCVITNAQIDDFMGRGVNLNHIEARGAARIINALRPDKVIMDCPSVNIVSYINHVRSMLNDPDVEIVAEFKADVRYPVVSAASILAKVTRDREVRQLEERYGIVCGSGYLTDPVTKEFLATCFDKYPIFRRMWAPWKKLEAERQQQTLLGGLSR